MIPAHPRVTMAVRAGGVVELDERGLMPLAAARGLLQDARVFTKGEGEMAGGTWVLDSDRLWAALLSLEDGAELSAITSRLEWDFQPRGFDNIDLYLRYGEEIIPWLATSVFDGVLYDRPWCVLPCLLACSSPAAFNLVWSVQRVEGRPIALATAWLDRHPEQGAACLVRRARDGDRRAQAFLAAMRARGNEARLAAAVAALGGHDLDEDQGDNRGRSCACGQTGEQIGQLGDFGQRPPSADGILALLDACAARLVAPELGLWPRRRGSGPQRCHALRVVAARHGGDWGMAIERLEGETPRGVYQARIAVHAFGSQVRGRYRGARIVPRKLHLDTSSAPAKPADFSAWLATRLHDHSDLVWGTPAAVLPALGLPAEARLVAVVPDPAHVDGPPRQGEESENSDAAPELLPSESPLYRQLTAELSARTA